ncbi:MAG: hypothetical protein D6698_15595 [Gammaproteobacteria bacterium]|nr:MAG: hypothetical protein D6698_15595 [Gammaproteobacteria bacterium]
MKNISVKSTIEIEINGRKYELTQAEARTLLNALKDALGEQETYPSLRLDPLRIGPVTCDL